MILLSFKARFNWLFPLRKEFFRWFLWKDKYLSFHRKNEHRLQETEQPLRGRSHFLQGRQRCLPKAAGPLNLGGVIDGGKGIYSSKECGVFKYDLEKDEFSDVEAGFVVPKRIHRGTTEKAMLDFGCAYLLDLLARQNRSGFGHRKNTFRQYGFGAGHGALLALAHLPNSTHFPLTSSKGIAVGDVQGQYYIRLDIEEIFDLSKNYASLVPVFVRSEETLRATFY